MINLTDIPRLAREAGRLAEITRVLARYGLAGALARLDSRFVRRITAGTAVNRLAANPREVRIRLVLTELGTTFIKFGQVLSTRRDLIGPALGDELAKLQSHVPADPFDVTRRTVESELGKPIQALFAHFDPEPLASASIGQVHRATLPDGRKVAVKVQHPDITRRVADDLAILAELAALAEQYLPEFRAYRPVAVVAEFERVLTRELDFRRELRHLQLFRAAFASDPGIRFPEPFPGLSSGRVLTMELFEGVPFNCPDEMRAAGGDFDRLARAGAKAFLDMIFRDGLFHADPHPGNLLFLPPTPDRPSGAIGLIDVGMVGRLDDRLRAAIDRGVGAVLTKDAAAVTQLIAQVGDLPTDFDEAGLEAEVADQLAFYHGMPLEQFELGAALNELTDAIRRFRVALPAPLALLLRVLVMLEGTGRVLAPGFNLLELLEPYKKATVMKKLSPRRLLRRFMGAVGAWDELARDFPRQVQGVMRMLHRREIGIELSHRHLEPSVNRLVFGLMVSALFVGSTLLWAFRAEPLAYGISAPGLLGCAASVVLGYRLSRAIYRSGRLEEHDRKD